MVASCATGSWVRELYAVCVAEKYPFGAVARVCYGTAREISAFQQQICGNEDVAEVGFWVVGDLLARRLGIGLSHDGRSHQQLHEDLGAFCHWNKSCARSVPKI